MSKDDSQYRPLPGRFSAFEAYSIDEVCSVMQIHERTFKRNYIAKGLPHHKSPSGIWIHGQHLLNWFFGDGAE